MAWFPIQFFNTGVTGDVTGLPGITGWLRAFNDNRDDFIIELSMPLLMLGFVAGTVDVFTGSGLSQQSWFSVTWGVIQALAIDGLFFAVWSKVRLHNWTKTTWFQGTVLVIVGLLLSVVASLVNNILTYQELNHVSDLGQVMGKLGIDAGVFSYGRSILVVLISILVALVARGEGVNIRQMVAKAAQNAAEITRLTEEVTGLRTSVQNATNKNRDLIEDNRKLQEQLRLLSVESQDVTAEITRLRDEASRLRGTVEVYKATMNNHTVPQSVTQEKPVIVTVTNNQKTAKPKRVTGFVASDDGQTVTIQQDGKTVTATGDYREIIKEAMLKMVEDNQEIKYPAIAKETGLNLSTIKKYGKDLKEEVLGIAPPHDDEPE